MTPPTNPTHSPQHSGQAREEIAERLLTFCIVNRIVLKTEHETNLVREFIEYLITEAEQRASAGMQAAALEKAEPLVRMLDSQLGDAAGVFDPCRTAVKADRDAFQEVVNSIRSLTQADGTNALECYVQQRINTLMSEHGEAAEILGSVNWVSPETVEREKARVRLEGERAVVGGMIIEGHESCTDCGRRMVWEFRGEPGNSWMCANCVCQRMKKAEQRIAELERQVKGGDA